MKKKLLLITFLMLLALTSCSQRENPMTPVDQTVGLVRLAVEIGPKGGTKRCKAPRVEKLILKVESYPPTVAHIDTLLIGETASDTFAVYSLSVGLDWTAEARVLDENGLVTHRSEPIPINISADKEDTLNIFLPAVVSNLRVGFIGPNGGKKAFLYVDDILRDTANITINEVVELVDPYIEASEQGNAHRVFLEIRGNILGFIDIPLYNGDTTIIAKSGEEFQMPLELKYVGPGFDVNSGFRFSVQIGIVGTIDLDGVVEKPQISYMNGSHDPMHLFPGQKSPAFIFSLLEDGFGKRFEGIKFESEEKELYEFCDTAYLVDDSGVILSQIEISDQSGEFLSFRNVSRTLHEEEILTVFLYVKGGISQNPTRFRCVRISGRTMSDIPIPGYFGEGNDVSPWSQICYLGD